MNKTLISPGRWSTGTGVEFLMTLHQVIDRVTSYASGGAAILVVSGTAHTQRAKIMIL